MVAGKWQVNEWSDRLEERIEGSASVVLYVWKTGVVSITSELRTKVVR